MLINDYIYNSASFLQVPHNASIYHSYYCLLWFDLDFQSNNAPSQQENLISQLRAKNQTKTKHYISSSYRH